MKKPYQLSLIVILLAFNIHIHAKVFSIRFSPQIPIHLENYDINDNHENQEVPSIGVFYNSNISIYSELRYNISEKSMNNFSNFFIGTSYSYQKLKNNTSANTVLGNKLSFNQLGFLTGCEIAPKEFNKINSRLYGFIGYNLNFYHGESHLEDNTIMQYNYKTGRSIRLALGLDIFKHSPVFGGLLLMYDWGSVRRSKVEVYQDSEYIGSYDPSGDRILPDYIFSINFYLGYQYIHKEGKNE